MSQKFFEDDLLSSEPNEGKLRLELRKLTNSDAWVSTAQDSSANNSRASTPLSLKSTSGRRGRPPKKRGIQKHDKPSNLSSTNPKHIHKPKKFRMVLEKDDDYEVDYLTPDEADSSTSSLDKDAMSNSSLSDNEFSNHNEELHILHGSPSYLDEDEEESNVQEEEIPSLDLPKSSDDLLLPNDLVLQALAVYEVLRHFRNSLRLSPFLFEDFCAALMSKETTVLINECHITLLKMLLKEEESIGTMFVPIDQKDAYNASLYFIDYMTWPEVLRSYIQSSREGCKIVPILEEENFPCVEVSKKIKVLQCLTDWFLSSLKIRDELMMDGSIRYDDHCRVCHRLGDLLCCESCPAVYHLACCDPPLKQVPEEEWQCEVCLAHKLNGVSNCEPESEVSCQYLRHDPIGYDRCGRKYWFLARRLFIESDEGIYYYTTYEEFKYVLSKLDHQKYEMVLCEALKDVLEEFPRQALITEELTNEARWKDGGKTQIEVLKENIKKVIEEEKQNKERQAVEEQQKEDQKNEPQQSKQVDEQHISSPPVASSTPSIDVQNRVEVPAESKDIPENNTAEVKPTETSSSETSLKDKSVSSQLQSTAIDAQTLNIDSSLSQSASTTVTASNSVSSTSSSAPSSLSTTSSLAATPRSTTISSADTSLISPSVPATSTTLTTPTTNRIAISKTNFIPLSIKVPLTRCDAALQPKQQSLFNQVLKINSKVQIKPSTSTSMTTLKNLYVLSKDGVKTPLTMNADGKLSAALNQRIIMINPSKTETPTSQPQSKLSRELKRLQFTGAGPKIHKMATPNSKIDSGAGPNNLLQGNENSLVTSGSAQNSSATPTPAVTRKPFRLGEDEGYKQYKNYYVENTLALNKYQHKEEKDKERHVGYKFSLTGPVEFQWTGSLYGSREEIVHTLRSALFSLEQQIPLCFMHSRWEQYRKMWGRMLVQNDSVKAFAVVLGILEMAIRLNTKKTVWKEGLGQVRMRRVTPSEKEIYEKKKKHRLKIEEDVAQRNAVWCKYPLPIRSSLVWKLRGEEYRVTGYSGWMWTSSTFHPTNRSYQPKPYTLFKQAKKSDTDSNSTDVDDFEKSKDMITKEVQVLLNSSEVVNVCKNLLVRSVLFNKRWAPSKVDKLLRWRVLQEKERIQKLEVSKKDINNSDNTLVESKTAGSTPSNVTTTVSSPAIPLPDGMTSSIKISVKCVAKAGEERKPIESPEISDSDSLKDDDDGSESKSEKPDTLCGSTEVGQTEEKAGGDMDVTGNDVKEDSDQVSNEEVDEVSKEMTSHSIIEDGSVEDNAIDTNVIHVKGDCDDDMKQQIEGEHVVGDVITEVVNRVVEAESVPTTSADVTPARTESNIITSSEHHEMKATHDDHMNASAECSQTSQQIDHETNINVIPVAKADERLISESDHVEPDVSESIDEGDTNSPVTMKDHVHEHLDEADSNQINDDGGEEMNVDQINEEGKVGVGENDSAKEVGCVKARKTRKSIFDEDDSSDDADDLHEPKDENMEKKLTDEPSTLEDESMEQKLTDEPSTLEDKSMEKKLTDEPSTLEDESMEQKLTDEPSTLEDKSMEQKLTDKPSTLEDESMEQKLTDEPSTLEDKSMEKKLTDEPSTLEDESMEQKLTDEPSTLEDKSMEQKLTDKPSTLEDESMEQKLTDEPSTLEDKSMGQKLTDEPSTLEDESMDQKLTDEPSTLEDKSMGQKLTDEPSTLEDESMDQKLTDEPSTLEDKSMGQKLTDEPSTLEDESMDQKLTDEPSTLEDKSMDQKLTDEPSTLEDESMDQKLTDEPSTVEEMSVDERTEGAEAIQSQDTHVSSDVNTVDARGTQSQSLLEDKLPDADLQNELVDNAKPSTAITSEVVSSVIKASTAVQEVKGGILTETVTTTTVTSTTTVKSLPLPPPLADKEVKLTSHSVEHSKQTSSVMVDESSGEMTHASSVRKISRRFRRKETHNSVRQSVESEESSSILAKTWKLVKSQADSNKKKTNTVKMPIPWNFSVNKDRRKSIFRLPRSCVRHMATRGGLAWYPLGFRHVPKSPTSLELYWPYRCVRPTVGTVWRYKLKNAKTLASIAHLLRLLWHSMRWEDIVTKPSTDDVIHTICNDDDIVSIELLKRRNVGNTGLRSEYFVRRIVMPSTEYDEEIPRSEAYTPSSRSGLRTRSRQMNLRERSKKDAGMVQPKVETLWMSEEQVELWQIRQFDSMVRLQQKAAASRKEAEAKEAAKVASNRANLSGLRPSNAVLTSAGDKNEINKMKAESVKHFTITPALLQQAAALHKSQSAMSAANTASSRIISLDMSQLNSKLASLANQQGNLQKLAIKPTNIAQQYVTIKANSGAPSSGIVNTVQASAARSSTGSMIQTTKVLPKKILLRPSAKTTGSLEVLSDQKPRHPTIKLAGVVGSSKVLQPVTTQVANKEGLILNKPSLPQPAILPAPGKPTSSMQVKLSANQLNDLMKVGQDAVVKVLINLADGTPGVGHLQVIPPGTQVVPTQGQQLMQCKVGNEVRRFLLTATATKGVAPGKNLDPSFTADSEVSLETPSLRLRLEQLQHRQQELIKPTSNNVHRLMTDKDPLWGGRSQHEKAQMVERSGKRESTDRPKKKYTHFNENKEERQRRNVVQQVLKSMLDRIERKEELEVRKRRREEREELQKRRKESMDMAKSQQRIHSRLLHALMRHEEQLKQEIRKRRTVTEKHLTHMIQNELYEDQMKRKKTSTVNLSENITSPPKKSQSATKIASNHVLMERNRKEIKKGVSPKKVKRRRSPSPVDHVQSEAPASKKRKMINSSVKLYCICQTPYDDARFYIGCDLCMNWFHGECVGIGERKAKHMDTWVCGECKKTQPQEELYCLCKTPYDDTQFYIGCDICQDWFHGRCVGISEDNAESIENYTCPRCTKESRYAVREKSLNAKELAELTKIVRQLQDHKMAWPFLEPVREVDAPGYYKVVTRPMDLQTVMKRLRCRYYSKLSDLVGDVSLIFDNCRQFNGPESNLVKCAEIVETVFVGKIRDMRGR